MTTAGALSRDPERCVVPRCRWWLGGSANDPEQPPGRSCHGGSADRRCGMAWAETFIDWDDDEVNPPEPPGYGEYLEQLAGP